MKVLQNVLFTAGYFAIILLSLIVSYRGLPALGLGIFIAATSMLLLLLIVSARVQRTNKRLLLSAEEADTNAANAPTKIHSFKATESYNHDAQAVWSLIRPAESAMLLSDAHNAFRVPGTPPGVGEQQCFISRDGSVSIIEVIGEESPWWATTRPIAESEKNQRSTYHLQPTPTGCTLTYGLVVELPENAALAPDANGWWESQSRPFLNRIKEVLDAGR